ncbi:MAG: ribonuclease P protein component [Massilibacteroides sp.]|nr:ribonuclease P protein component [Massilibacteroides sp.]MDD3062095.1 ribonuclease P protein component [Massilibacteroides sp.]MDD4114081.1 ribonuclease P protein component [Massilibacteroides sp.]MDD4659639.1 ribonuclease P protein component [Massilibacteroides sp.]
MTEKRFCLTKEERLSWKRHIDLLFEKGQSFVAFPLRVIYLPIEQLFVPTSILTSVSKKKFKRAVKRNKIKRQIRETYRLQKEELQIHLEEKGKKLLIAFLYVDKEIHPHTTIEKAMKKSISLLKEKTE